MGYYFQTIDTENYIKKFSLKNYAETGTGEGATLQHALDSSFEKTYSVEINSTIYQAALRKFNSSMLTGECNLWWGNSFERLPQMLSEIEGNTLFFLDAHFPGADFHLANYEDEKDYDTRLPLEKEIEVIIEHRDVSNDVFIIDDLVIFEPDGGPYEAGPLTLSRDICPANGIKFLETAFGDTHDITRSYVSQGFLIITPKMKKKFTITNNDGVSTWVEDLYNKYLPSEGVLVEAGVGHTVDRHWTSDNTAKHIKEGTVPKERCGSNTLDLLNQGYKGVYIDPVKEFCDEVSLITRDIDATVVNVGCSDREETSTMYGGETFLPNHHTTWPGGVDYIGREVPCMPISDLLDELTITSVDLMSIDVEGWEMKALDGIRDEHLPKVMIIEIDKTEGVHDKLAEKGYTLIYKDHRDAGYVMEKK